MREPRIDRKIAGVLLSARTENDGMFGPRIRFFVDDLSVSREEFDSVVAMLSLVGASPL